MSEEIYQDEVNEAVEVTETNEVEVSKTVIKCPNCEHEIVFERPVRKSRGVLAGVALEEMDYEQLKIEKRNASSVLYKAKQRAASPEIIEANTIRVNNVLAEMEKRVTENPELAKTKRVKKAKKEETTEEVIEATENVEVAEEIATEV